MGRMDLVQSVKRAMRVLVGRITTNAVLGNIHLRDRLAVARVERVHTLEQARVVVRAVEMARFRPRVLRSVHPVGMGNTRRTIKRVQYVKKGMHVRTGSRWSVLRAIMLKQVRRPVRNVVRGVTLARERVAVLRVAWVQYRRLVLRSVVHVNRANMPMRTKRLV